MKKLLLIMAGVLAFGNTSNAQCDQNLVHFLCYYSLGMTIEIRNSSDFIIYQNIINSENNPGLFAFQLSLADGCYTFSGLNDPNDYYIVNVSGVDINGTSQFYHDSPFDSDSYGFSVGGYGGCTDPAAVNYVAESCLPNVCNYNQQNAFVTVELCDGINGVVDVSYEIKRTCDFYSAGYGGSQVDGGHTIHQHVITPGEYEMSFYDYGLPYSFTYTVRLDGNVIATGSEITDLVNFTIGSGNILGCTDNYACNYDSNANCDDGSCIYCCPGWPTIYFSINDDGDEEEQEYLSFSLYNSDLDQNFFIGGYENNSLELCLPGGYYEVYAYSEYGEYAGQWVISGTDEGDVFGLDGETQYFTLTDGGGGVSGCTDPLACNFDPAAATDDGSCSFVNLTIHSPDDGDGIAESMLYYFNDNITQQPATSSAQLLEGQTVSVCLYPSYFTIILTPLVGEMDWELSPVTIGTLTGTSTQYYSFFTTNGGLIYGCTDPLAENYENWASIDAGTCTYPSVPGDFTDDGAVNTSDLLILLSQMGCTGICSADLSGDGAVNTSDVLLFLSLFGA